MATAPKKTQSRLARQSDYELPSFSEATETYMDANKAHRRLLRFVCDATPKDVKELERSLEDGSFFSIPMHPLYKRVMTPARRRP